MTTDHRDRDLRESATRAHDDGPVPSSLLRTQARLQVVLDRKLGRETPDWIREIAES